MNLNKLSTEETISSPNINKMQQSYSLFFDVDEQKNAL